MFDLVGIQMFLENLSTKTLGLLYHETIVDEDDRILRAYGSGKWIRASVAQIFATRDALPVLTQEEYLTM